VTDTRDERAASTDFKYTRYDESAGSTHELVVGLVPEGTSVLEVGCATGYMTEVLVKRRGCRVVGIELDAEAAAAASAYCDRVIVGDIESLDLEEELGEERFDAVLFADVLEHLRDPVDVLERVRQFVAEDGVVIASIPNVAHVSVRLALLGGEFRYREKGLLDDTHLRFFTRESIVDLFESSGFVVSRWLRRRIELDDAEISPRPDLVPGAGAIVRSDPEATTYQFVVCAIPSDSAAQLADLRAKVRQSMDEASEELELLRKAHDAQARHLIAERLAFAEAAAAQEQVVERLREEIEWRKGVIEDYEAQLQRIRGSRAYRYSAPIRRLIGSARRSP
jgi:2-polyprenyl-3-methyl-5-hydroxy-6-metoxy-1,4-benzoquinol methylase